MPNIKTFEFNKCKFEEIKKFSFGFNWPVVYLIEDGRDLVHTNLYKIINN